MHAKNKEKIRTIDEKEKGRKLLICLVLSQL